MRGDGRRRFNHRLALALGRTVTELLCSMTSMEMAEWQAYDAVEPIGDIRRDIHAAIVAREVANNNPYRRKPKQLADFMPFQARTKPSQATLVAKLGALKRAALAVVGVKRG